MVLGGIVAAGLGAGAAWVAIPRLPAAWQPVASTPAPDPAALTEAAREAGAEAARSELARAGTEIESRAVAAAREAATAAAISAADASLAQGGALLEQARQAGAEAATKLLAEAPAGANGEASVQAALAAQAQQLAALDKALNDALVELRAAPAADAGTAPAAELAPRIEALERQLAALAERPAVDPEALAQLRADAEAATARVLDAAEQAQAQLAQAESRAGELADAADEAARRARTASAAVALSEALQTGAPRQQALSALAEAGVEPAPALTGELPTLEALAEGFAPAARAALRDARAAEPAQGTGSVIGNFLRAQTGARSVAPREGTDADAVLSRAGDAVQRGAIAAALDELSALPEPARPAMADWTAQAQAYVAAQAALGALVAPPAAGEAAAPSAPAPAEPAPVAPAPDASAPASAPGQPPAGTAAAPSAAAPSN